MKARKVYEFKRTRKQGLSDKTKIGIKHHEKQNILDWFKKWEPTWEEGNEFIIKDDLSVVVLVNYGLDLADTDCDILPFNKFTIHGGLNLKNTPITKLPEQFHVTKSLTIAQTKIKELPENFYVGLLLDIRFTKISKFPNEFFVGGSLDLEYSNIKELPDNLHVHGFLDLGHAPISKLPNGLKVDKFLNIKGTNITELPDDLIVLDRITK